MKKIRFSLLILVQILWVASINAQTNVYDTVCVGETSTYYIDKSVPSYPNSFQGGVDTLYSWSLSNENMGSLSVTSDATVNITWNSRGEVQLYLTETIKDTMVGVADTIECARDNMLYIKIYDTISNSVLAQPSDVNQTLGANVGFASGLTTPNPDQSIYGVISYQWQKSDSPEGPWNNISGATNHQLNISNISLSDVGYYRCHVTAHCNDVFTDAAHLTIIGAPEIYLQPIGAAICEGSPQEITFTIGATGADNDPLTYQWEKSTSPDGPWTAIQGAVDSFYVISQPQVADEGYYHCVVNSVAYPNVNVTSEPCHFEVIDNMVIYFTTNNVTCNGAGNGSIKVDSILNGYPPFSYEWSNGATSNIITDLTPGSYTLHVTEGSSSGCEIEKTVEIDEPLPIRLGIDTSIWEYAQWIHGQDHQLVEDLHVDKVNHNYYQTGSFETELKYGPTTVSPGNSGSFDMFVSKVVADGEVQWTRHAGGSSNTYGKGVGCDNEGNVYVGGSFNTTICFYHADNTPGPLLRSHGFENNNYDDDGYIVKYDENGNYVNAITFGGIFNDHIQAIHVNGDGQIFVTGSFEGDITIQGQTISSGSAANVFVARFNSDLSLRWLRAINDQSYEQVGQSIIADVADNTYISGYFQADRNETENSDAIEAPLTQQDLFIARFDFAGDLKWVKTINGTGFLTNGSLAVDYSECVYHTGTFANAAQLRESNGEVMHNYVSAGGSDGFVQKFDRNGYLRWASTVGGTGNDSLKTVATDVLGNTYVAGNFSGELTFNNHTFTSTPGSTNAFVAKFANVESNHPYTPFIPTVWGNVIDGNNYQNITTITVDNDQNIYVGGDFSLSAHLGDTLLEAGYPKDAFVARLKDTYISKDPIIVDADCPEDPSGSIQLFISGGTLPYDYVWSIPGDTAILDPVESGRYWFWIGDYYNTWDDSICGFNQSLYVEHLHNAPAKPNYITVDTNYFCAGALMTDQITLTAHTTPTNLTDSIFWREGDCFTGTILNGNAGHTDLDEYSITIDAPTDTTTYYAYWVSEFCGRSLCAAITVYVKPQPVMPESIVSDTNNFCVGSVDSIRLTAIAGSGRIVEWLSDTINYTIIGTGEHFSIIAPAVSTTYFARWKNECGMSACQSYTINVIPYPASTIYELSEEYCSNSPIDTLIGMPEGGTWSGQGVTRISPTQATFNPAIAIMGINEILYTVSDNGCDSTFVATTIVHAAPQPEFEGLDSAYCYDGANVLLTGSYAPFGTFTCNENPDAIENIGYGKAMFKPTIAGVGGPYHITYIFEDVATGCIDSITKTTSVLKPQLTIEGLP
ncbi:MAG: SBBP repeat-containing protein [Bacteroidales bacterium]|nr:SBBP repeat-containing protein [Bacteroidales bacterium]